MGIESGSDVFSRGGMSEISIRSFVRGHYVLLIRQITRLWLRLRNLARLPRFRKQSPSSFGKYLPHFTGRRSHFLPSSRLFSVTFVLRARRKIEHCASSHAYKSFYDSFQRSLIEIEFLEVVEEIFFFLVKMNISQTFLSGRCNGIWANFSS